ncbi:MAG: hypothetical protein QNK03_10995 [Myxococcota bacterium]|nr:hypothetical protein [Myxococcota bacterium]
MLESLPDALELLVGFWRYAFSPGYRERKRAAWRREREASGWGAVWMAGEIAAATAVGVGLPVFVVLFVAYNV